METIKRNSCRAVVLSPENEILLIKIANPSGHWLGWITPGGGMEEGETEAACLARELREELGLPIVEDARPIWRRFHSFVWNGKRLDQNEMYFLVRTEKFLPAPTLALTESELRDFRGYSWWALAELKASREEFAPRRLAHFLEELVERGPPSEVIDVGI